MIYQLVSISVENKRIQKCEEMIAEYNELIKESEETKEIRSMRWWIIREARELGLKFDGDSDLN